MNKPILPKAAMCEFCEANPATSFSRFTTARDGRHWFFTCSCTSETEEYYVQLDRFFDSQASTVDWLAHLHEKPWQDWKDFMDMMHRFRQETECFGKT